MGQALYRKHRPKSLKEVVGQEHVTDTLERALEQGRISHAYLFTGPRGVGKTSIARILAHQVNGLPYTDDSAHIDIIEIDAASNRRIDEIRELREKVYMAPVSAKYKVYIIDEVHMLTKEAFNALLKTLEEPPAHVVFILATTEAHKLPDTIISRTQRFSFKPVDAGKVAAHLADIAKKEKVKISPAALDLLASHGGGSFRDSISLLDQLSSHGSNKVEVNADDVRRLLGIPPDESVDRLMGILAGSGGMGDLVTALDGLLDGGFQAAAIAAQIGRRLRGQLVEGNNVLPAGAILDLLSKLIEVPASHDPSRFLELTLLGAMPDTAAAPAVPAQAAPPAAEAADTAAGPAQIQPASAPEPVPETTDLAGNSDAGDKQEPIQAAEQPAKAEDKPAAKKAGTAPFDASVWSDVLQTLKRSHNTLYGVVRMAEPSFDGDTLSLAFAFAFHEKRIKEASNRQKLSDVIYGLTGRSIKVECTLDKSAKPPEAAVPGGKESGKEATGPGIDAISNIFGAAELLES